MTLLNIDHVQIAAPRGCESQARSFYGALLGLEKIEKADALVWRGVCWFRVGPHQLHIGVQEDFAPAKKAQPVFAVTEIDCLFSSLTQAGVACQWDDAITGVKRFYASDPWGNRLEFTQS